jgi:hypothetical protein
VPWVGDHPRRSQTPGVKGEQPDPPFMGQRLTSTQARAAIRTLAECSSPSTRRKASQVEPAHATTLCLGKIARCSRLRTAARSMDSCSEEIRGRTGRRDRLHGHAGFMDVEPGD